MMKLHLPTSSRSVAAVAVALAAVALAFVVSGQVPAARASGPGGQYSSDTDEATVAQVLGRPLPRPTLALVAGMSRSALTIDPISNDPFGAPAPRIVRTSFGLGGRDVALLSVFKGTYKSGTPDEVVVLSGRRVDIFARVLPDGSTDVGYLWGEGGLVYNFHINVGQGITRPVADELAGSVR